MDKTTHEVRLHQWKEIIQAQLASGQNKREWCRENGIVPNTYFRWQKKVFNASCSEQGQFYEVPLSSNREAANAIIEINGVTAKVFHGADKETIRSVLLAMRSC